MRYIDADALKEESNSLSVTIIGGRLYGKKFLSETMEEYKKSILRIIDEQPTADVVPNSEVENYKQIAEYQQKLAMDRYFEIKRLEEEIETLKDNNEHLAVMLEEAQQGVDGFPCVAYNKKHERYQVIHKSKQGHIFASKLYRCREEAENALAELKKKYTEEKK
jgi:uncharacterized protein YegP (UPF0339 family)